MNCHLSFWYRNFDDFFQFPPFQTFPLFLINYFYLETFLYFLKFFPKFYLKFLEKWRLCILLFFQSLIPTQVKINRFIRKHSSLQKDLTLQKLERTSLKSLPFFSFLDQCPPHWKRWIVDYFDRFYFLTPVLCLLYIWLPPMIFVDQLNFIAYLWDSFLEAYFLFYVMRNTPHKSQPKEHSVHPPPLS